MNLKSNYKLLSYHGYIMSYKNQWIGQFKIKVLLIFWKYINLN